MRLLRADAWHAPASACHALGLSQECNTLISMRLRQLPATRVRNGCSVQRAKCVHLFATASVIESVLHLMADKRSRLCRPSALLQCGDAAPCAHWPLVQLPLTAVASAPCESSGSGAQYGLHLDYIWTGDQKVRLKVRFTQVHVVRPVTVVTVDRGRISKNRAGHST